MSDEQGCVAAITGPRAALHIQKLISWMLILKRTPAKTLQGTKAECDTAPATVPARILSVVNILTMDANNSIKYAGAEAAARGLSFDCLRCGPSFLIVLRTKTSTSIWCRSAISPQLANK